MLFVAWPVRPAPGEQLGSYLDWRPGRAGGRAEGGAGSALPLSWCPQSPRSAAPGPGRDGARLRAGRPGPALSRGRCAFSAARSRRKVLFSAAFLTACALFAPARPTGSALVQSGRARCLGFDARMALRNVYCSGASADAGMFLRRPQPKLGHHLHKNHTFFLSFFFVFPPQNESSSGCRLPASKFNV